MICSNRTDATSSTWSYRGHGDFVCNGEREAFVAGDALFAAAGVPHCFERFSEDLAVWVMFYGPHGGEAA